MQFENVVLVLARAPGRTCGLPSGVRIDLFGTILCCGRLVGLTGVLLVAAGTGVSLLMAAGCRVMVVVEVAALVRRRRPGPFCVGVTSNANRLDSQSKFAGACRCRWGAPLLFGVACCVALGVFGLCSLGSFLGRKGRGQRQLSTAAGQEGRVVVRLRQKPRGHLTACREAV